MEIHKNFIAFLLNDFLLLALKKNHSIMYYDIIRRPTKYLNLNECKIVPRVRTIMLEN